MKMLSAILDSGKHGCLFCVVLFGVLLAGCQSTPNYQLDLMQAPGIFSEAGADPFPSELPIDNENDIPIFYATDRKPVVEQNERPFYENARGHALRLGVGEVKMVRPGMTWEEVREVSLLKARTDKFPLQVESINEMGYMHGSEDLIYDNPLTPEEIAAGEKEYAEAINRQLEKAVFKDIYIYVHGYKVVFDNPLLVASELWHFMGYQGVYIAYAWPSTPKTLAYMSDVESAQYSSHNLRKFIEFLAENTEAENIHVLGYSAGTRVVVNALQQLALKNDTLSAEQLNDKYRLGETILVGSDYDRDLFIAALQDGLLNVQDRFTLYFSSTDKALTMSRFLFGRNRLGQILEDDTINEEKMRRLGVGERLQIIYVSSAEGASSGNGHAYFRSSPWVSSDVLLTFRFRGTPQERGLIESDLVPLVWAFPDDYMETLKQRVIEANLKHSQDNE